MSASSWNGPAFATWLRRWKEHEKLEWNVIAERSGLSLSTLGALSRGRPDKLARERGQTDINPGISTLARLAEGLGLDLAYVLAKGGLYAGAHDRWDSFDLSERTLIHSALNSPAFDLGPSGAAWEDQRRKLTTQLETTLTEEIPA